MNSMGKHTEYEDSSSAGPVLGFNTFVITIANTYTFFTKQYNTSKQCQDGKIG